MRKYFDECDFVEGSDAGENGAFCVQFSNRHTPVLIVDCPCLNDVLFRQGKNMMEHPGNAMFRDLILDYLDREEAWKAGADSFGNSNILNGLMQNQTFDLNSPEKMGYGKYGFLNSWILNEIFNQRKGRFLEWDRFQDLHVIKNKISIVFSKHRNRKTKPMASYTGNTKPGHSNSGVFQSSGGDGVDSASAYRFVQGRMPGASLGGMCCNSNRNLFDDQVRVFTRSTSGHSTPNTNNNNTSEDSSSMLANRKRGWEDL
eukprot:CAMPEP_0116153540 /NCGR_PEP_ID=MMETSP0329-20121206/21301_1 /TAXON_ID=697910 /ORGANISM="Pseudo-nitzschia arenysensis, Strain B593" /LENGTH=257 /DNA_ID=CAMNT_0003650459 /DNA_START=313 /DNA_END=1086 /DNA_ORIENTATION=-